MSATQNPMMAMTGQYNLFESQGFKVGPSHGRVTGGLGEGQAKPKKKQGALFGKSGLPGQMNLFADKAVPDELVAKPKAQKKLLSAQRSRVAKRKKHALPALAAVAGRAAPAILGATLGKNGLAERGEKIGSDLGGTIGGAGGALVASKAKVIPKKTAIGVGTTLGRKAGGALGRRAGAALAAKPKKHANRQLASQMYGCKGPAKMSLAQAEATRVSYQLGYDEHETNLALALAEVRLG